MSAENIRLAETIREDILTCPICFETFDDARTLPCLHTYCRSCLFKLIEIKFKKVRIIRCPECRAEVRLFKNGIEDIKPSFFIHNLMEIYNTKRQIVTCTVCKQRGNTRDAVSKCTTCGDGLCFQCSSGHLQSTTTVLHRVIPLKDFASGMHDLSLRETQNFPCMEHKKELEYYCNSCEAVACLSCVLLEHKDHMYTSIQGAFASKKGDLDAMFNEVKSKVTDIETAKAQIQELKAEANRKGIDVIKTIGSVGQNVLKAVGKEVSETKQNADKVIKPRLERLKNLAEELDEKIKQGKNAVEFCRNILANGKPVEVLQIEGLLRKRLQQLSEDDKKINMSEIEFNNRIKDVFINERFRDDIHVGIFQKETSLSKSSVSDTETQTELSGLETMTNGKVDVSNTSNDIPDASLFGGLNDSGLYSLSASMSLAEDRAIHNPSSQTTSPGPNTGGEGNVPESRSAAGNDTFRQRERRSETGNGEPVEAVSLSNTKVSQSKGSNWFTDIPGDMAYSSSSAFIGGQTNVAYCEDVIKQMVILALSLILMFISPFLSNYIKEVGINEPVVEMCNQIIEIASKKMYRQ